MRKIVLSGVAAFGFLAVGLTVLGHPGAVATAASDGSGADVRANHTNIVAMVEASRTDRPLLVALSLYAPTDTGTG
jgi:hypothetical protein